MALYFSSSKLCLFANYQLCNHINAGRQCSLTLLDRDKENELSDRDNPVLVLVCPLEENSSKPLNFAGVLFMCSHPLIHNN